MLTKHLLEPMYNVKHFVYFKIDSILKLTLFFWS